LETGVILLLSGLTNLESKSVSTEEKMMVSSGWTSTISRTFSASGQSTNTSITENSTIKL